MKLNLIAYRHFAADPFFNMAFDEWMLGEVLAHPVQVLIRLYSWKEGSITFGYNQRRESAFDAERLGDTPAIRRITGGRALYHDPGELTYSVALNESLVSSPLGTGSVSASSAAISDVLVDFLSRLGIKSDFVKQSSRENARPEFFHKAPCFASHARHEVVAAGEKIIASAQRRVGPVLLQHGAIKINGVASHPALPLSTDKQLSQKTLVFPDEQVFERCCDAFVASFADKLSTPCRVGEVSINQLQAVIRHAEKIKENPYSRRDIFKHTPVKSSLLDA